MANYPKELAQDAVCQSHTGHLTGLWFLPTRPLRLNTNEWINICIYNLNFPVFYTHLFPIRVTGNTAKLSPLLSKGFIAEIEGLTELYFRKYFHKFFDVEETAFVPVNLNTWGNSQLNYELSLLIKTLSHILRNNT